MQAATLDAPHSADVARLGRERLREVILARIASAPKGVGKTQAAEDAAGFFSHKFSPAQWRAAVESAVASLVHAGLVVAHGAKLEATREGQAQTASFLASKAPLPVTWGEMRDRRLVARALGLEKDPPKRLKALATPEGLRAAILQKFYNLKIKGPATPARLRAGLAAVALNRAFGNRGRDGVGGKLGLSPKAGRTLAGQLARRPRDFGTDARLVAALAAEQVGALQADLSALQLAVLRAFLTGEKLAPQAPARATTPVRKTPRKKPRVRAAVELAPAAAIEVRGRPEAPAAAIPAVPAVARPTAAERPDLAGFSKAVRQLAAHDAQGWAGNRKAYISHIWRRLMHEHAGWGLSEIEFKCMLAEAHRAGHVALANADLKDANSLKDVQESAVVYKNAVFHYVRVDA